MAEEPRHPKRQRQRGVVLARLDRIHGLARHLEVTREGRL
jgi:hypothetical protein